MSDITQNFNLTKDASTDYYDINTTNENLDKIDKALGNTAKFETASGTGTNITLTGIELVDGHSKAFVVSASNNGAATTINGVPLYKPGTTQAPKLVAGKAVTVWYNDAHFFIKASAEGDAVAENVLAGKTFSNDEDTGLVGTMPNNGPTVAETINLTTENAEYAIPKGFHSGLRKIRAKISGLIASVIKAGVTVGGILGTFTSDGDASAWHILSGKKAYVNGALVTGDMPNRGALNPVLGINGTYTIPSGYHNGAGKVTQTIPTQAAQTITPGTANQTIPSGRYLNGVQTILGDPDLISANILKGKNVFGVDGNVVAGMRFVTGFVTSSSTMEYFVFKDGANNNTWYEAEVISGLPFRPRIILMYADFAQSTYSECSRVLYVQNDISPGYLTVAAPGSHSNSARHVSTVEEKPTSGGGAYVSSVGFRLPASRASTKYTWIAFE